MVKIEDVTKTVYTTVKSATALGNRVFPIVATEGTQLPYAVFERSTCYDAGTKDGNAVDMQFTVRIVTATYFQGLTIADDVRTGFRHIHGTLESASEEYTDEGYVQALTFSI